MKKKILSLVLVVALAATAVIGGTLAYFTDTDDAHNAVVVGNVDITLDEQFDDKTPLLPGDVNDLDTHVQKLVNVKNEGEMDAYVRVLIAYEDTKDVGQVAYFNSPYFQKPIAREGEDKWVIAKGDNDWLQIKDKKDGTVYTVAYVTLSEALKANATTETPILKSVALNSPANNEWVKIVGDNYDVLVMVQGSQMIEGKTATESIDAAFGFEMGYGADAAVAKLFTDAGLGEFEAYQYTSEGAWVPSATNPVQ